MREDVGADVASETDNCVLEVDFAACGEDVSLYRVDGREVRRTLRVGDAALIEDLQQYHCDVLVRLLELIEQDYS